MRLEDAMFLWMPVDASIYYANPRQGRLLVVERGQNDAEYPMSAGSCDHDWNEAVTDMDRLELLQSYVSEMVWSHGLTRDTILNALSVIDGINPLQLDFNAQPASQDD